MTLYPNIYGVIPSPATVTVLTGRGMVLENCAHCIPVVNLIYIVVDVDQKKQRSHNIIFVEGIAHCQIKDAPSTLEFPK